MALGNLKVTLTLAADQFVTGIKAVQKEFSGLGQTLTNPAILNAGAVIGAGMLAAGTGIAAGLLKATTSAANYGDAMFDLSQKTGISASTLGSFKLLADQSGTSIEGLSAGMKILSKNMLAAATDSKSAQAQLFSALGIPVKDASGNLRDLSDIMPEIAERFKGMEDGALKNALAQKLMGRSGEQLIPFLNEGAAAMREAQASAEKYGVALTDAEAAMSDKFNDTLEESKAGIQGLSNAIGFALIPDLTLMVEKGNEWLATASQWVKSNPEIVQGLAEISVGLIGGGGILVGLTSIAFVLPNVVAGMKLLGITTLGAFAGIVGGVAAGVAAIYQLKAAADFATKLRQDPITAADPRNMSAKDWFSMISIPGALSAGYNYYQGVMNPADPKLPKKLGVPGLPSGWEAMSVGGAGSDADLKKLLADLDKKNSAAEIERFNEAVKALKGTLTDTTQPSKELVTAIRELDAAGMMTAETMLRLGKHTDTLKNSEDARIQQIVKSIPFLEMANNALQIQADILKAIDQATKSRPEFDQSGFLKLPEMAHPELLPEGDIRGGMIKRRADEAVQGMKDQRQEMIDLGDTIAELSRRNMSATEIEDALGISLERVAERARELNVEMPPLVGNLASGVTLSRSWGESLGELSDHLVDMIVDFDFSFKRLADIAKDTAKDMARSFLDGLFKPFKEGLEGLGKDAGDWAAGLLFGTKTNPNGGGGGLFSGLLSNAGGLLGGLFKKGGGNSVNDAITENVLGGLQMPGLLKGPGSATASTGGGLLDSIGGLGGVGGLASLAIGAVSKIGAGRDSANEIVKLQNAFVNQTLAGILADPNLSATNKMKLVGNEFDIFQQGLNSYAASGGENAVTANQALASVSPLVSNINRDLIAQGATDATGEGGGFTHNGDVIVNAVLPNVHSPEQFLDWYDKNRSGIRIRIAEGTFAMEGAIVTR